MAPPSNKPRPRRTRAERRLKRRAELANALAVLGRSERDLLAALVTLIRFGDVRTLRAVPVLAGLTVRAVRRQSRRDMDPLTAGPWRP